MPELPEVETFARLLRDPLVGKTISNVECNWPRHIDRPELCEFHRRLEDRVISTVQRRGKYLVIGLDDDQSLIIHLKMTGHLSVVPATDPADDHVHTVFSLSDGNEFRFRDTRKFGRIYLVEDAQEILSKLGPEPLSASLTEHTFQEMLLKRKRILKPLLLDQSFIAGIGNIYADEALHSAGILPTRISNTLSEEESRALFHSIQEILTTAIDNEGATIDDYRKPDGSSGEMQNILRVYGRADNLCYRCGDIVERMVLGGSGNSFLSGLSELAPENIGK